MVDVPKHLLLSPLYPKDPHAVTCCVGVGVLYGRKVCVCMCVCACVCVGWNMLCGMIVRCVCGTCCGLPAAVLCISALWSLFSCWRFLLNLLHPGCIFCFLGFTELLPVHNRNNVLVFFHL